MGNLFAVPVLKRNIVLIGNTGNGKSSAGNVILRKTVFITKVSANSVTTKCLRETNMVNGKEITFIDTPDFFDIEDDDRQMKSEIIRALVECAEGIHAFIIVLKVGRYTTNEKKMVQQLLNTMTNDVLKHTVILFTFGNQLEGQTIKEFVQTNSQLQELVDKCGGRCHVIDKYWKRKKKKTRVGKLLKTIDEMVQDNKGCYKNKHIQNLMNAGLLNEEAKNYFHAEFVSRAARIATGTLVGFFLGAYDAAVPEIIRMISESLGPAVPQSVRSIAEHALERAVRGAVSEWNAGRADSESDTTSKAALTSLENAITLMNNAQTKLQDAKNVLEAATNMLKKK